MNTSLYRDFKLFCAAEQIVLTHPINAFFLHHPLVLIMFIFYMWDKTFANVFPNTSVQMDLLGVDSHMLFTQAKDIYINNPCSPYVPPNVEPLHTIVTLLR